MGSIFLYVHVSINKMKTLLSIIFVASVFNWTEGAPFSKLGAIHSGDICKNLELQESEHHLLADPDDCKKFFSCQYSRSGWLAYSMSCADGTHFDGVYCVTGDSCVGIDLFNKEETRISKIKYFTTSLKSTQSLTTTENPNTITTNIITEEPTTITTATTTTEVPTTTTTTTTTEIPTTTTTTKEIITTTNTTTTTETPTTATTIIIMEIPTTTTTTTTEKATSTTTTEEPTTMIITKMSTTITQREIPTTTITTKIPTPIAIKTTEEPTGTPPNDLKSFETTTEISAKEFKPASTLTTRTNTRASSSSITTSKAVPVVSPGKFLPDETQGEFLPVESLADSSTADSPEESKTEVTTDNDIGLGEIW